MTGNSADLSSNDEDDDFAILISGFLTQIILGGAVGEAVLGKRVGSKAVLLWGAIWHNSLTWIPHRF